MFVCHLISELRFYGCCPPCLYIYWSCKQQKILFNMIEPEAKAIVNLHIPLPVFLTTHTIHMHSSYHARLISNFHYLHLSLINHHSILSIKSFEDSLLFSKNNKIIICKIISLNFDPFLNRGS